MHVRPLRLGDRAEWLRLLVCLYPHSTEAEHLPAVEAYLGIMAGTELIPAEVFVCEREGGGLAAMLELSVRNYAEGCEGNTPYVESWFVDEDVRTMGIGRMLIEAAAEWSRQRGYTSLASDAELGNEASHLAHRATGFEEVERVVHFRMVLQPRD